MSAHLYLLPEGALSDLGTGDVVVLDGDEGHHAATVKRTRVGERIQVADGSGRRASVEVEQVEPGRVSGRVVAVEDAAPAGPRFVLAQALAKGGRDEQAVEAATELGVDEVLAWQAGRSVVVWRGERGAKSLRKWGDLVRAASKQSRRATVPTVAGPVTTGSLAQRVRQCALALVLDGDADAPLAAVDLPDEGDILVVVGPEGGIAREEVEALTDAGALPVRLGPEVLRASNAGPAALAVLAARSRWRRDP